MTPLKHLNNLRIPMDTNLDTSTLRRFNRHSATNQSSKVSSFEFRTTGPLQIYYTTVQDCCNLASINSFQMPTCILQLKSSYSISTQYVLKLNSCLQINKYYLENG
jgi:hypothetical protein